MTLDTVEQPPVRVCPYKGLIPYGEEDAPFFFGREKWCKIILNNLLASHLTLLYGSSGVGKSSVLQAGVVSRLKKQAREKVQLGDTPDWAVIVCRDWRDNPIATLRARIATELHELTGRARPANENQTHDLLALLKTCSQAVARHEAGGVATPGKLLLILDQFEEYFLYHPQEAGAGCFAEQFPLALNDPELSLNVLISLRDDSLSKLDRFKQHIPDLFANRLHIDHLNRDEAIDAIRKPIEEFNRQQPVDSRKASVEPQLIQDVLEQVKVGQITAGGQEASAEQPAVQTSGSNQTLQVETPFLQLVMMRLWEEESRVQFPPRLRRQTLSQLGGAGKIVREHLQRLMMDLPESSKRVAAIIFDKLVTSGLTKIAYPVFELTDPAKVERQEDVVNRQELMQLLDHLSGGSQRILRRLPPALEQANAEERYEIFHDVLAKPILEWRHAYRDAAERKAEQQRHAEELERERQSRRKLRRRNTKIFSILGVIIAGQLLWILRLWAQEQKLKGIEAAQQFKAQQLDQIDALVQAMEAAKSLSWLGLVDRRDVAANLRHILDNIQETSKGRILTQGDDSTRVIKFSPDGDSVGILFHNNHFERRDLQGKSLWHLPPAKATASAGDPVSMKVKGFAFARQRGVIATVSSSGVLLVWDEQGKLVHRTRDADLKDLPPISLRNRLHFSPDGNRLAFIDRHDALRILDLDTPEAVSRPRQLLPPSQDAFSKLTLVRFAPSGDVLATANEQGRILFLHARTGQRLPAPESADPAGRIYNLEFAHHGQSLATASPQGVRLWLKDPQGRWTSTLLRAGRTSQVRFSPDGRLLATAALDGRARLWAVRQAPDPRPIATFLNQAPVQDARFTPDGHTLLTVSTAGVLHEWKVPEVLESSGPTRRVSTVAFSSGGQWLAQASSLGVPMVCLLRVSVGAERAPARTPTAADSCPGTTLSLPTQAGSTPRLPATVMAQLAFDSNASRVAGLYWRGGGWVWNRQGQPVQPLPIAAGNTGPFSAMSFSPEGRRLAVVARGNDESKLIVCSVEPSPAKEICQAVAIRWPAAASQRTPPSITSVRFLPRSQRLGRNLVISTAEGQICFGSLPPGQKEMVNVQCHPTVGQTGNVWQLSLSPDGSRIGLAGFDGTLHIFQHAVGDQLRKVGAALKVSAGPLLDVSFSPQGGNLVAVSLDGTASLWDGDGRLLASFPSDEDKGGSYLKAVFSSDGRQVLLATTRGTVKQENVEDLPKLLDRGCAALKSFLANPVTDKSVRRRLAFCRPQG
ncbi:MAG: WD40 repeat domain-containing protein [Cyanobacteriota bacterium]|nr:WD40 repeat domain-containing protein [Cyanobacteriota bacterium]